MDEKIRFPAVAGQFYEADPLKLKKNIARMLSELDGGEKPEGRARALVVPHAGYVFSGKTALKTFSAASSFSYKRILIIAPSHRVPFQGLAFADYSVLRTPLGDMKIDSEAIGMLSSCPYIQQINQAHAYEHALEVELPFIQTLFPDIPIIPFISGHLDVKTAENIAEALSVFWNEDTLWVISSDFTHYGANFSYRPFSSNIPENIKKLDMGAIEKILQFDLKGFSEYMEKTGATICGENPLKILLAEIAKDSANLSARLIEYTSSGEMTGDYSHCVSYAGIAVSENVKPDLYKQNQR